MKNKNLNIITGAKHSGKTTNLIKKIEELKASGKKVAGIISVGTFKNNSRHSFFVKDISTGNEKLLMTIDEIDNAEKIGRFYINNNAFAFGEEILKQAILSNVDVIVLDELGKLEIDGKGWAEIIPELLDSNKELFFVIRDKFIEEFTLRFGIDF